MTNDLSASAVKAARDFWGEDKFFCEGTKCVKYCGSPASWCRGAKLALNIDVARIKGREEGIKESLRMAENMSSGLLHLQTYGNPTTGDGEREPYWQHLGAEEVVKELKALLTWWPKRIDISDANAAKELDDERT